MYICCTFTVQITDKNNKIKKVVGIYMWLLSEKVKT